MQKELGGQIRKVCLVTLRASMLIFEIKDDTFRSLLFNRLTEILERASSLEFGESEWNR